MDVTNLRPRLPPRPRRLASGPALRTAANVRPEGSSHEPLRGGRSWKIATRRSPPQTAHDRSGAARSVRTSGPFLVGAPARALEKARGPPRHGRRGGPRTVQTSSLLLVVDVVDGVFDLVADILGRVLDVVADLIEILADFLHRVVATRSEDHSAGQ